MLVEAGRRLGSPELGLLANAGHATPLVRPRPRVVVLSTGDELIPPGEFPEYGQVHDSNAYTLFGALREAGAQPVMAGIVKDDVDSLKETVLDHLIQADAFISSGGVSVGERDVVKAAFFRRGDVDFYRVAMQPGMPQGFGHIEGKPYFGLPGNPVSVFVSFEQFVRPAILKMMGRTRLQRPEITATLTEDVSGPKGKLQFARVRVARADGGWAATPTGARGSNLISTVVTRERVGADPSGRGDGTGRFAGARPGLPRRRGLSRPVMSATSDQAGADGRTRIVEVGAKEETREEASAECWLTTTPDAAAHLARRHQEGRPRRDREDRRGDRGQGDPTTAPALPPDPCHRSRSARSNPTPIMGRFRVVATVRAIDRTGVEMEALTAAAVAALSLYDTAKAFDRAARIDGLRLLTKSGGKSGDYRATD